MTTQDVMMLITTQPLLLRLTMVAAIVVAFLIARLGAEMLLKAYLRKHCKPAKRVVYNARRPETPHNKPAANARRLAIWPGHSVEAPIHALRRK